MDTLESLGLTPINILSFLKDALFFLSFAILVTALFTPKTIAFFEELNEPFRKRFEAEWGRVETDAVQAARIQRCNVYAMLTIALCVMHIIFPWGVIVATFLVPAIWVIAWQCFKKFGC